MRKHELWLRLHELWLMIHIKKTFMRLVQTYGPDLVERILRLYTNGGINFQAR